MGEVTDIKKKLGHNELDDLFIRHYLECSNKAEAYRRSCDEIGHEYNPKYANQYGFHFFERLQDVISETLDKLEVEDAALSRNVLRKIAEDGQNESSRVAAAKELARKRIDRPSLKKKSQDIKELDKQIKAIKDRLEGK